MIVFLLGRRDHPTDALEDYCRWLGAALMKRGCQPEIERVDWLESGRLRSLYRIWRKARSKRGQWIVAQYTALGWSRRGFSLQFLGVLLVYRVSKVQVAIVFHDPEPFSGNRVVDKLRRICQLFVVRTAYLLADRSIFNVPLERISWLPPQPVKAAFIPIGANLPPLGLARSRRNGNETHTIAVFTLTDAGDISKEVSDIAFASLKASEHLPHIRLLTMGRGSGESASSFRKMLKGSRVDYTSLGILSAEEVSQVLANADVSLFVRGPISTQRGSAIASISNGVPLVAYSDLRLPAPLAEAGVMAVRNADAEELAVATVRVLTDRQLWNELHERSRRAHEKYFSWQAVASRFTEVLQGA